MPDENNKTIAERIAAMSVVSKPLTYHEYAELRDRCLAFLGVKTDEGSVMAFRFPDRSRISVFGDAVIVEPVALPPVGGHVMVTWEDHRGRPRRRACRVLGHDVDERGVRRIRVNLGGKDGHRWFRESDDCWDWPNAVEQDEIARQEAEMACLRERARETGI